MSNILIFCPDLGGHRQNYVYVIANYFLKIGFCVIIGTNGRYLSDQSSDFALINQLASNNNIIFYPLSNIDCNFNSQNNLVKTVIDIEKKYSPILTFFPTADELIRSLKGLGKVNSIKRPYRTGIFISITYFYIPNFFKDKFLLIPKRVLVWLFNYIKQHIFFFYKVWGQLGLNSAITINPDFKRISPKKFKYMPDIYKPWSSGIPNNIDEIDKICTAYKSFIMYHPDKNVIMYFGGRTTRRGYEILLRLACDDENSVFVSAGRDADQTTISADIENLKRHLTYQDRIWEVNIPFLPDNKLIDMLFESCKFVILPYNNFYGPSGLMIQACSYGKPVLVTNIGYLNSMVKKFKIGITYRANNYNDLYKQYNFMKLHWKNYVDSVYEFNKFYELSQIEKTLNALMNEVNFYKSQIK